MITPELALQLGAIVFAAGGLWIRIDAVLSHLDRLTATLTGSPGQPGLVERVALLTQRVEALEKGKSRKS